MKDRKSMVMVIVIGITISLFLCFNTTVFAATGTVTTSDLRLRKEENTSSEILTLLDENDEVEILGESEDWYKIKANGKVGYASKQYIKVKDNPIANNTTEKDNEIKKEENNNDEVKKEENPDQKTVQDSESKKIQNCTVSSESQIRIMPLINGDIINTTKSGEKFEVISNVGLWSYIRNNEKNGWVLTEKVSLENNENNIPENASNQQENPEVNNNENQENKDANKDKNEENKEENKKQEDKTENNKSEEKTKNTETTYSKPKTYYVKGTSVNARSEANTSASVVKRLDTNNEVKVTGEDGNWYIVDLNGKKAYISKTLLSTKKVETTSRSTTSIDTTKKEEQTNNVKTEEPAPTNSNGSSSGEAVVAYAKGFLGYPYVYGKNGPSSFDCSGFVQYVYKHFGYSLSRSSKTQANDGRAVSKSDLQPGDILIFKNTAKTEIGHVGIYIGNNQFIHASNSRTGVIISSLSTSAYQQRYVTARRVL